MRQYTDVLINGLFFTSHLMYFLIHLFQPMRWSTSVAVTKEFRVTRTRATWTQLSLQCSRSRGKFIAISFIQSWTRCHKQKLGYWSIVYWNKALWLDVPRHMTIFSSSDDIISVQQNYAMLEFVWHQLLVAVYFRYCFIVVYVCTWTSISTGRRRWQW